MNKKILTTVMIAGTAVILGGLMNSAFAQDSDTTQEQSESRPMMHEKMHEKGKFGMKQHMKGDMMEKLDEATQAKLKALHETHRAEMEALKDKFADDKEGFREAMKTLHEKHMTEMKALLPADFVAKMGTMEKNGMKMKIKPGSPAPRIDQLDEATQAKVKALHETHKAEMEALKDKFADDKEGFREAMKTLHEKHITELEAILPPEVIAEMKAQREKSSNDFHSTPQGTMKYKNNISHIQNKLDAVEAKMTPEQANKVFTLLLSKLQEKSDTLETKAGTMADATSINEVISILDAIIVDIQARLQ